MFFRLAGGGGVVGGWLFGGGGWGGRCLGGWVGEKAAVGGEEAVGASWFCKSGEEPCDVS